VRAVLDANGIQFDELTEDVRAQILDALGQMSGSSHAEAAPSPKGTPTSTKGPNASPNVSQKKSPATKTMSRAAKNQKEIVIEIAELKGKGYPSPVDLDTGANKGKRQK